MSQFHPTRAFAITPSDSETIYAHSLYIGDSGDIEILLIEDTASVTLTVVAGTILPWPVKKVLDAGTTCTKIHGFVG